MSKDDFTRGTDYVNNIEVNKAREQIDWLQSYIEETNDYSKIYIKSHFAPEVDYMLQVISPETLIEWLKMAVEKDAYRPRDMSIYMFAASSDLENVAGEFSTFDAKLSRMLNGKVSARDIKNHMVKTMRNTKNVAEQYRVAITQIIDANPDLRNAAIYCGIDGAADNYSHLLSQITKQLCFKMKMPHHWMAVKVIDSWEEVKDICQVDESRGIYLHIPNYDGVPANIIVINRSLEWRCLKEKNNQELFNGIIATLAHEFGHFIDRVEPNRGAVGAQKSQIGHMLYEKYDDDNCEDFLLNPTELSSFAITEEMLKSMAEKSNG